MTHLLDTCICVFLIRGRSEAEELRQRIVGHEVGEMGISSITEAELRFGADKSAAPERNHRQLDRFLLALPVLPFGCDAARQYGTIRAALERSGTPIGPLDLLIAAHALAAGLVLVTHNVKEFARVPGLAVEDWGEC